MLYYVHTMYLNERVFEDRILLLLFSYNSTREKCIQITYANNAPKSCYIIKVAMSYWSRWKMPSPSTLVTIVQSNMHRGRQVKIFGCVNFFLGGGRNSAGAEFERRRREDWGTEGVGCGKGCPPPHRGGIWEKNLILALNMMSFGAFGVVFLLFSYLFYTQNGIIWCPSV